MADLFDTTPLAGFGFPSNGWPRPLAFVFSGGAAFGATQVGMLRALDKVDLAPDLIVGTSVGALNGTLLAANPREALDALAEVWSSMTRSELLGGEGVISAIREVAQASLKRSSPSLGTLAPLGDLIDRHVHVTQIESLQIPMHIVATDALLGEPVVLSHGPLRLALQASSAVPGVFPPVKHMGRYFIDGGVTANVPVQQAIEAGAKSLVVLDCIPSSLADDIPSTVIGSLLHASHIMLRNQPANVDVAASDIPMLRLPQTTPPDALSIDFSRSDELISLAYSEASAMLSQLTG